MIIGVQLLFWFVSGVVFAWMPIGEVRGEHLVSRGHFEPIPPGQRFADPAQILSAVGGPVKTLEWRMVAGRAVAEVETASGARLFDAATAAPVTIGAAEAERIVRAAWTGPKAARAVVERVTEPGIENGHRVPAWRVVFPEVEGARVYLSAETGRITAVRTDRWRLYDLLWALHIMDWVDHEDINTPWLLGFGVASVALWLAGLVLLIKRRPWRRRRKPGS